MTASAVYPDNSLLVSWPLRNEADGSLITSGVTVTATVYEAGTSTEIQDEGGNSIMPVTLSYDADEEEWQGTVPADADYSGVDQVDIQYVADGGDDLSAERWDRNVPVRERSA